MKYLKKTKININEGLKKFKVDNYYQSKTGNIHRCSGIKVVNDDDGDTLLVNFVNQSTQKHFALYLPVLGNFREMQIK